MDQIKKGCQNVIKQRLSGQAVTEEAPGPRVLVTGATGFLGGRLVERLSADGVSVRATTRLMSRARPLSGIQWVRCDLAKEDELRNALAGMETVFHCAAMAGPPGSLKEYEAAKTEGALNFAKMCGLAGVTCFAYSSAFSVYENPRGSHSYLNESTAYERRAADRGSYSQSKLRAAKALLEYATNG